MAGLTRFGEEASTRNRPRAPHQTKLLKVSADAVAVVVAIVVAIVVAEAEPKPDVLFVIDFIIVLLFRDRAARAAQQGCRARV